MLGGLLEITAKIFGELGDKGKALIVMVAIFALGAAAMLGTMSWINLPAKAEANAAAIDSLGVRVGKVEEKIEDNTDYQHTISRRLEIMCRELLDNPNQCDLRFNPEPVNIIDANKNSTIILKDETQQTLQESGVREFRPGQRQVLPKLPISSGGDGD